MNKNETICKVICRFAPGHPELIHVSGSSDRARAPVDAPTCHEKAPLRGLFVLKKGKRSRIEIRMTKSSITSVAIIPIFVYTILKHLKMRIHAWVKITIFGLTFKHNPF